MDVWGRTLTALQIAVALLLVAGHVGGLDAEEAPPSDRAALNRIFGDHFLAQNVIEARQQAAQLPPMDRFQFLKDWVLPSHAQNRIRLAGEFVPVDTETSRCDGILVSPVFDLIAVADDLGQLENLRSIVKSFSFEEEVPKRNHLAFLCLIDFALHDIENALQTFDQLARRLDEWTYPELHNRWAETLVLWQAAKIPDAHADIAPTLFQILTTQIRVGVNNGPIAWDRHISALASQVKLSLSPQSGIESGDELSVRNWIPVSHGDCVTRALGFPAAEWRQNNDVLFNVVSHHDDYLYYRIPLTGDFEVECDLGGFDYRDTELRVHGICIVPHVDLSDFFVRDLRGERGQFALDPPLSWATEWIRHRVIVKDDVCTIIMNGREVYRKEIWQDASPWLAIRSPFYGQSWVRDVRMTGDPVIPEELSLSGNPELSGWLIDNPDAGKQDKHAWRYDSLIGPEGGIVSPVQRELQGSFLENVLRYERPLLEDSEVEYDFHYRQGEFHVHPTLDRRVFLLERDGVRIHRLTDGVWDRSGLDPQNASVSSEHQFRAETLPLRDGWNHLEMTLEADTVEFELNGQPIYREQLNPDDIRKFGLFHYADQTAVRVRNVRYRGVWPKEFPTLDEQELRDRRVEQLDAEADRLREEVAYSFENKGYSGNEFVFHRTNERATIQALDSGLKLHQPGAKAYGNAWVSPRIMVAGDFDIETEFEQATLTAAERGECAIYLTVVTTDRVKTHAHVLRGAWGDPNDDRPNIDVRAEFNLLKPNGVEVLFEGRQADETTSGRMRIARRGKMMYFLNASGDSPLYRVIYEQEVNDTALMVNGIRLATGSWSATEPACDSSVVWKRLNIKADSIRKLP